MSRPLTPSTSLPDYWTEDHVGLIHWNSITNEYFLVVDVSAKATSVIVSETAILGSRPQIRLTASDPQWGDLFWTPQEFARIMEAERQYVEPFHMSYITYEEAVAYAEAELRKRPHLPVRVVWEHPCGYFVVTHTYRRGDGVVTDHPDFNGHILNIMEDY